MVTCDFVKNLLLFQPLQVIFFLLWSTRSDVTCVVLAFSTPYGIPPRPVATTTKASSIHHPYVHQHHHPPGLYIGKKPSQKFPNQVLGTNYLRHHHYMAVEGDFDPNAIARAREQVQSGSIRAKLLALYKFTRPHTIRGTILASIAGTIRALIDTPGAIANANWSIMLPRAFLGMLALLLGNAFIVGINQIFDKEIDELNKPFLPVASGEMSKRFAWFAVVISAIVGPALVWQNFPGILFRLYSLGLVLGGIYSVPPFRTKQNPFLAAITIATVRGFLLNFGVYYAVKNAMGAPFAWSPKVAFIARFMTVFATIIAITKDLPDTEGDKAYQIETFATKIGVDRIAKGASLCLLLNYVHAVMTGLLSPIKSFHRIPMLGGHIGLAVMLWLRFRELNANSISSVKKYYKHIWDLFYLEYVLYTLI